MPVEVLSYCNNAATCTCMKFQFSLPVSLYENFLTRKFFNTKMYNMKICNVVISQFTILDLSCLVWFNLHALGWALGGVQALQTWDEYWRWGKVGCRVLGSYRAWCWVGLAERTCSLDGGIKGDASSGYAIWSNCRKSVVVASLNRMWVLTWLFTLPFFTHVKWKFNTAVCLFHQRQRIFFCAYYQNTINHSTIVERKTEWQHFLSATIFSLKYQTAKKKSSKWECPENF